jgi:SOS-response transcriptional repressor LexA
MAVIAFHPHVDGAGLGGRVRLLRKRLGITQDELAAAAGLTRPHVSDIERGRIAALRGPTLDALAGALGVSAAFLAFGVKDPAEKLTEIQEPAPLYPFDAFDYYSDTAAVPIEAEVACGEPMDYTVKGESVLVPKSLLPSEGEFLLRARGDSMIEFGIRDGDYLVVERRKGGVAADGEIVIAWLNGGITMKRWRRRGGRKILQAGSPEYPSHELGEGDDFELQGILRRRIRVDDYPKISG